VIILFGKRLQKLRALEQAADHMVATGDRFACGWAEDDDELKRELWRDLHKAVNALDETLLDHLNGLGR
jgi:acyl-coenzyme A synthetase/AMP-(fatty) acid ligase